MRVGPLQHHFQGHPHSCFLLRRKPRRKMWSPEWYWLCLLHGADHTSRFERSALRLLYSNKSPLSLLSLTLGILGRDCKPSPAPPQQGSFQVVELGFHTPALRPPQLAILDSRLAEAQKCEKRASPAPRSGYLTAHLQLLNCIMDMAEKTRRSLTVLRRCQEADREELNHWVRRYSDAEDTKKGPAPTTARPLNSSAGTEGSQLGLC